MKSTASAWNFGRKHGRLILPMFVFAPALSLIVYYLFFATDMYISEAEFSIRGAEDVQLSALGSILSGSVGSMAMDAYIVGDFIHSHDMLHKLEKRLGLKAHYSSHDVDPLSRLPEDATLEEQTEYFRQMFKVVLDPNSHITTLSVRAFTPEMAQRIAEAILGISEELVNELSDRAREDALHLAQEEIKRSEERVLTSRLRLKQFKDERGSINPEAATGAIMSIIAGLEEHLAKDRALLSETLSYLQENSPQVVSIKARIKALEGQIAQQKRRLTGQEASTLNTLLYEYEKLLIEREFAEKQYALALGALEAARVNAEKKQRYLVAFVKPSLPEYPLYPNRPKFVLLITLSAVLLFGILSLLVAAVREHSGF